jgi:VWFA-related protein
MRQIFVARRIFVAMMLASAVCALAQVEPEQTPAQAKTYTLTLGTKLMVVDVTVKDKRGKPVHGLKLSDFTLNENGKPQQIRNFDEHTMLSAEEIEKLPAFPKLPSGDFTNLARTPPNAALNVILIDRLNTALSDQTYLTEQLLKYARQARPDARTAVFGLTNRLLLLQGFSSNPALLLNTLESSNKPKESGNRVGVPGHSGAESMTVDSRMLDTIKDQFGGAVQARNIQEFEHQAVSDLNRDRAKMTLDALNQLGRVLVNLPGRKNLVWFSGDFPPQFFPGDSDPKLPDMQFAGLADEFQSTVNLLTRARVAVYPVDAQGLRASQFNNASSGNPQLVHQQTLQDARNGPEYG